MGKIDLVVGIFGVATSFGAAAFWLWASLIDVPDNIDTFINALQQAGQINSWAAMSACAAALCGTYTFARSIGWI
jgi:hypothetical protein